jgi:acyl-CoA synthetase (AMP-forming)/AMP-acid ligase II
MERYLGDEGATSDIMKAGWTTCEDLGFLDSEGYLFLAGRARELIISGGINVYPAEVEAALLHHPAIADAAVFGLPDAQWGEAVATAVVLREPIATGELRRWALSEMLPAKAPRRWFIVDELPRNPTGKIIKRELQARFIETTEASPA